MNRTIIVITAILSITALLILALLNDVDGVILAAGVAVIAGLGGYVAPHKPKPQ